MGGPTTRVALCGILNSINGDSELSTRIHPFVPCGQLPQAPAAVASRLYWTAAFNCEPKLTTFLKKKEKKEEERKERRKETKKEERKGDEYDTKKEMEE